MSSVSPRFRSLARAIVSIAAAAFGMATCAAGELPPASTRTVDYRRDVQPVLARSCYGCHGPEKQKGGLRLDRKTEALAGGGSGQAFEPGKSADSLLVQYVAGLDPDTVMPPKGDRLTPEQIGLIRAWIDQGAAWPEEPKAVATGPAKTGSDHWAFQPVRRPGLPRLKDASRVRNPIDAFILANLDARGVEPSPEADRPTLIRRLSLDLLGLPPTPAEVDAFVNDAGPGAYERLVERNLGSPHYGERWGRHWLDLARYADSDGYEKDSPRPNAWRYRDWVIDALNRDLPFDAFTVQQLAGDLVPGADLGSRTGTGFHRNTLTNREGGVDQEEYRIRAVVDRVNTTGTVWLGLTVGCAQCHSHKYDPLSQKEYYGLFAFFNGEKEEDIPAPLPHEPDAYRKAKETYDAEHARLVKAVEDHDKTVPGDKPDKDPVRVKLQKAVAEHLKKAPAKPASKIPALAENSTPPKTHVLIRGDFLRKGDEVQPATPAVLPRCSPEGKLASRLDLARWLVDPGNPLTPRVTVNRVWHYVFGRGLVPTLDDFGTRGERPSHPELLDWLADEFIRLGWSQKALLRTIVTSATYRQSSRARPDLADRDPTNIWLARQHRLRLEAEVLRDVNLAASGLLAPVVGGPSVHPPQPSGISDLTYAGSARWVESTGPDRYRRGLYTWFQRTSPYPMLMTFDAPDSNVCAVRRERSNTPIQALTLLNDTTFLECARGLGARVIAEAKGGTEDRVRRIVKLCLCREPSPEEVALLTRLHDRFAAQCRERPADAAKILAGRKLEGTDDAKAAAWVAVARTVLNLDEFVTRE